MSTRNAVSQPRETGTSKTPFPGLGKRPEPSTVATAKNSGITRAKTFPNNGKQRETLPLDLPFPVSAALKAETGDTAGLPAWLRKAIETENPTAFGKLARWKKCRCGQWTISGWDANDDYAGHATTDPTMLSTAQEAAALLARRWTYNLIIDNGTQAITLARRDQWQIPAHPATGWRYPVTPAHRCGQPLGQPIPSEQFEKGNH